MSSPPRTKADAAVDRPGRLHEIHLVRFISRQVAVSYLDGLFALAVLDGNAWTLRTDAGFLPNGLGDF